MKEALVKFGRGVYDTWYGATATFLVVSIMLHGLQMVNVCLNDVVPWPKEVHVLIMMLLVLNVCVATIVSLVRRKWARALGQVIMLGASFVCCAFVTFFVYCTPTRMTIPPGDEWVCETISMKTNIGKEKLNFLGGISAREPVVVYEVVDGQSMTGHSPQVYHGVMSKPEPIINALWDSAALLSRYQTMPCFHTVTPNTAL